MHLLALDRGVWKMWRSDDVVNNPRAIRPLCLSQIDQAQNECSVAIQNELSLQMESFHPLLYFARFVVKKSYRIVTRGPGLDLCWY